MKYPLDVAEKSVNTLFQGFPQETHDLLDKVPYQGAEGTLRELIISHFSQGTTPNDTLKTHIDGLKSTVVLPPVDLAVSGKCPKDCVENWALFIVDTVLAVISVAGLKSKLSKADKEAIAAKFNKKDLIGIQTAFYKMQAASGIKKAFALFSFVSGFINLIGFKVIWHGIEKELDTWTIIEDLATVVFQLLAWFGSDGWAAAGELLLTCEALFNDGVAYETATNTCSLDQFYRCINAGEKTWGNTSIEPLQKYSPACLKNEDNIWLFYRDPVTAALSYRVASTEELDKLLIQRKTMVDSGNTNVSIPSPWSATEVVPGVPAVAGAPTCVMYNGSMYVFYQKKPAKGGDRDMMVYYVSSSDGKTWSGESNLPQTCISPTIPSVVVYDNNINVFFMGSTTSSFIEHSYFNGEIWSQASVINDNITTSTTPCANYDEPSGTKSIMYRGFGSNEKIYQAIYKDGSWGSISNYGDDVTTSATPAGTPRYDPVYRGTGKGFIWYLIGHSTGAMCIDSPVMVDKYFFYASAPGVFDFMQAVKLNWP